MLAEARRILGTHHPTRVLHGEVAAEILVDCDAPAAEALEAELRARFSGLPIDVALLPSEGRRKRLLLALLLTPACKDGGDMGDLDTGSGPGVAAPAAQRVPLLNGIQQTGLHC